MKKSILHISTECYPAAKAGGMGDVVGALPKYLSGIGYKTSVIIPKYGTPWIKKKQWSNVHEGKITFGEKEIKYTIHNLKSSELGFNLFAVDIPGLFDRPSIYLDLDGDGFKDEPERNIGFQIAVTQWVSTVNNFDLLHCHDHQSGLIPFFTKYCPEFKGLREIPCLFTIHNAQYRGIFNWAKKSLLPAYDEAHEGLLDWDQTIHSFASAVRCAWAVNTVSPTYMLELKDKLDGLESLMKDEVKKCSGIINGIDYEVWNPGSDPDIKFHLKKNWPKFKEKNKEELVKIFSFNKDYPLISFIGRFAYEKGADLIHDIALETMKKHRKVNFLVLGSGSKEIERSLGRLSKRFRKRMSLNIAYNEKLAHQIYAGSDFLLMPSRFEPCGLNQMMSMRYGTIPIVHPVGGLRDTVPDISEKGNGFTFSSISIQEILTSLDRSLQWYKDEVSRKKLIKKISSIDFSWTNSAKKYAELYDTLTSHSKFKR